MVKYDSMLISHWVKWFLIIFLFSVAASGPGPQANVPVPAAPAVPVTGDLLKDRLASLQVRSPGVAFYIHTVKPRENLWKIAARRRYSVHSIIGCNPELGTYDVAVGQRVIVPARGGSLHTIQLGDTWQKIADRYGVESETIQRTNAGVSSLVPGEYIFVPGARPDMALMNPAMRAKYELRALFTSPLGGRLSSVFGKRRHPVTGAARSFHGGIDIAVPDNTWVGAAAAGVVTVASSGIGHYGTAVFIDHGNGYETQYGHLSKVMVRPGQRVKPRQLIAKSGSTGRVTGPHLHFTIKKNGVHQDPLRYIW